MSARPHYFHQCPLCPVDGDGFDYREGEGYGVGGAEAKFLNVGREHWFICHFHAVKWHVGSNLFSGWRSEDEATWRVNSALLAMYREVEPKKVAAP